MDIRQYNQGISLTIRVQPRASKNSIQCDQSGTIKVRLTSPPVDGEANEACIAFLASVFHVPKSRVSLISGQKSRTKVVSVEGVTQDQAYSIMYECLKN